MGAAFLSAVGYVAVKQGLETANYKLFIILGLFIGVVLSGALLWSIGSGLNGLTLKGAFPFIITGGFGGGLLARVSITRATHGIGASRTHALTSASTLVTALFGVLLLGEVINLQLGIGMGIVVVGASSLSYFIYSGNSDVNRKANISSLLGLALAFYGMVMFGLHPILRKIGMDFGATPLQGAFIRFLTGFSFYLLYLLITHPKIKVEPNRQFNYYIVAGIAWALSPVLAIYAVQFVSTTVYASLMRVGPLFTVILAYFFLKGIEKITWKVGVTALLIVVGAILVSTA